MSRRLLMGQPSLARRVSMKRRSWLARPVSMQRMGMSLAAAACLSLNSVPWLAAQDKTPAQAAPSKWLRLAFMLPSVAQRS